MNNKFGKLDFWIRIDVNFIVFHKTDDIRWERYTKTLYLDGGENIYRERCFINKRITKWEAAI